MKYRTIRWPPAREQKIRSENDSCHSSLFTRQLLTLFDK